MASLDEERYLRHLWLLGEGGLFVLRGVVSREATKSRSPLDKLLKNGRARFKGLLNEQQHRLFPTPTTVNADIYTWDMSLLFVVLKKLFWSGLSLSKRASLSTLKTYRNDFQGHPTILSMNASDYSSNRQLLEQALRQLASGINGNVEIESIIKRTATGRIDSNSISKHIREIYDFKTSFLTAVEDMLQRVNSKFSSIQGNQELVLSKLTKMELKNVWKTKHEFSRVLSNEKEKRSQEEKDLLLPINVTNIEQLTDIWNMFGGAERRSNVENISATLSQILGETIRLKTYVDNDQVQSIVYETGYIESQPENSTDGQSSDKKHIKEFQSSDEGFNENPPSQSSDEVHKKPTQSKFPLHDIFHGALLSMTDILEVRKKEEVYWVKSVLALKITADYAMRYLAMSVFKQFYDSLTYFEKDNLQNLLDIAQNRHKRYTLKRVEDNKGRRVWEVNAPDCKSLLEKLVSAHWDPAYVEWDNIGDTNVESYWKIAMLYMPHGNKNSTCPEDTDMIAIFHMLRNFKVEDLVERRKEIDQMICHSKDLIVHSDDNRISRKEMTEILENINKFIGCTKLRCDSKSVTQDLLEKVQLISNSRKWYSYKRVIQKQRTGLAVEVDKTEEFLNITKMLLLVFKRENAMEREYGDRLQFMFSGALAGAATGAILGPAGIVIGCATGAAIGALVGLEGLFRWS